MNARNVTGCAILRVRYWYFLFGGYMGATLSVRVCVFLGGWTKTCCAQLLSVRVGLFVGASEF